MKPKTIINKTHLLFENVFQFPISFYIINIVMSVICAYVIYLNLKNIPYPIFYIVTYIFWLYIVNKLVRTTLLFEKIESPIIGWVTNNKCLMCNKKRVTKEYICPSCFCKYIRGATPGNEIVINYLKSVKEKHGQEEALRMAKKMAVLQLLRELPNLLSTKTLISTGNKKYKND